MRFHELFEYHRKNSAKKWKTALAKISPNTDPEEILKKIEKGDPTDNKTYIQWIISQLRENPVLINDMGHIHDLLKSYEYYKLRLPKEQQDIYKLTYQQVFDIIDKIDNPEVDFENTEEIDLNINGVNQNEYNVIYDGPLGRLVVPKTKNAACILGHGTKWCTAATRAGNRFDEYAEKGKLYYWRDKTGKYAFHFEKLEFRDEHNKDIDWDILKDWRNNHSVLEHLFKKGEKHLATGISAGSLDHNYLLGYFHIYALKVMDERLSKNPENIFLKYADIDDIRKYVRKYPESANVAESIILNKLSSYDAIMYNTLARKNERWPEYEKIMLSKFKNGNINDLLHHEAYYIRYAIKERWSEFEEIILGRLSEDDISSIIIKYVKTIIKEKWPEFEQVLLGSIEKRLARKKSIYFLMQSATKYAKDILGIKLSQWKELMKVLKEYDYELPNAF